MTDLLEQFYGAEADEHAAFSAAILDRNFGLEEITALNTTAWIWDSSQKLASELSEAVP